MAGSKEAGAKKKSILTVILIFLYNFFFVQLLVYACFSYWVRFLFRLLFFFFALFFVFVFTFASPQRTCQFNDARLEKTPTLPCAGRQASKKTYQTILLLLLMLLRRDENKIVYV